MAFVVNMLNAVSLYPIYYVIYTTFDRSTNTDYRTGTSDDLIGFYKGHSIIILWNVQTHFRNVLIESRNATSHLRTKLKSSLLVSVLQLRRRRSLFVLKNIVSYNTRARFSLTILSKFKRFSVERYETVTVQRTCCIYHLSKIRGACCGFELYGKSNSLRCDYVRVLSSEFIQSIDVKYATKSHWEKNIKYNYERTFNFIYIFTLDPRIN